MENSTGTWEQQLQSLEDVPQWNAGLVMLLTSKASNAYKLYKN